MSAFSLNNKKFKAIENRNGLSSPKTLYLYFQKGSLISGEYQGGPITLGRIVGRQLKNNKIELLFQCMTDTGELKAGHSIGEITMNESGKLQLSFDWEWLNGVKTGGKPFYIEVDSF